MFQKGKCYKHTDPYVSTYIKVLSVYKTSGGVKLKCLWLSTASDYPYSEGYFPKWLKLTPEQAKDWREYK